MIVTNHFITPPQSIWPVCMNANVLLLCRYTFMPFPKHPLDSEQGSLNIIQYYKELKIIGAMIWLHAIGQ